MEWIVAEDSTTAERAAAEFIAARLADAIAANGRATFAISGGRSPWGMLDRLADQPVDWNAVHLFQVDERRVPAGHAERNWARFLSGRLAAKLKPANLHPVPVEIEPADRAAAEYEQTLVQFAGSPPAFDVIHLGVGEDGHTASLFADDPLLDEQQRLVGVSRAYQGTERITMTPPVLNAAHHIVWFVTGEPRREIMARFADKDSDLPSSRVERLNAAVFADSQAVPAK